MVRSEPYKANNFSHAEGADLSFCCGYFYFSLMDKIEILEALESAHGTSNPLEVAESDRWQLYETIKSNIRDCTPNPDDYTRQIILISETLEL